MDPLIISLIDLLTSAHFIGRTPTGHSWRWFLAKLQGGWPLVNVSRDKGTHTLFGTWKPRSEVLQPSGSGI